MCPRSLFGRPSKEEMDAFWMANKSRFSSDFRSKWSFDPESSGGSKTAAASSYFSLPKQRA
jgi:hypothetical protein